MNDEDLDGRLRLGGRDALPAGPPAGCPTPERLAAWRTWAADEAARGSEDAGGRRPEGEAPSTTGPSDEEMRAIDRHLLACTACRDALAGASVPTVVIDRAASTLVGRRRIDTRLWIALAAAAAVAVFLLRPALPPDLPAFVAEAPTGGIAAARGDGPAAPIYAPGGRLEIVVRPAGAPPAHRPAVGVFVAREGDALARATAARVEWHGDAFGVSAPVGALLDAGPGRYVVLVALAREPGALEALTGRPATPAPQVDGLRVVTSPTVELRGEAP